MAKPCKNGATCVDLKNGYHCLCKPGFKGKDCDQGDAMMKSILNDEINIVHRSYYTEVMTLLYFVV